MQKNNNSDQHGFRTRLALSTAPATQFTGEFAGFGIRKMSKLLRWATVAAVGALLALPTAVQAIPSQYDLTFNTSGQSIWDTGESFTLDETKFLGIDLPNQKISINLIAGDDNTTIVNPLRAGYDIAFGACTGLGFSSSACINGQTGQFATIALGPRPTVRSCGFGDVLCAVILRPADEIARSAYDVAFEACRIGFSATACINGQPAIAPLAALGPAPPSSLQIDSRTGIAVNGTVDGRIGLELGVEIDSGSVEATVSYEAKLEIPDTTNLDIADPINFNTNSVLAGVNTLDTTFANLEVSVDAIVDLSGNVTAQGCLFTFGCETAGGPFDIDETAPVLSFNEDGEGGILLFGQKPSTFGLPAEANGFPLTIDIKDLVELTLYLPKPDATGGLDTSTQTLKATGQDDLLDILLDVDNIIANAARAPGLFGQKFSIAGGSVFYTIINLEMGPTIDLQQDFELDPTLFVEFAFDKAVMVGGKLITSLTSAWDSLPDIIFQDVMTMVTPTFFLDATLLNETLLDFDLQFIIDLLQIGFKFPVIGEHSFGIGNVLDEAVDLFDSPNLYSNLFSLGGFNPIIGESFMMDFTSDFTPPIVTVTTNAVPEPSTIFLFLAGLFGLHALRRRDQFGGVLVKRLFGRTVSSPIAGCDLPGKRARRMKFVRLVLCGLLFNSAGALAAGDSGNFAMKGAGFLPCSIYVDERETKSNIYYMIGGWLEGYLTAHNKYTDDTYDITSFESLELLLRVVLNHCESNPEDRLYSVVDSIIVKLEPDRLRESSKRLKIAEGKRQTILYRETIRRIQAKLTGLGLYKGKVDGRYTDETKSALIAFQSDIDFETTGFPDQTTLWRLLRK